MADPLEITMSKRYSARWFTTQNISSEQLLSLLRNSYGYVGNNRVLPRIGSDYSLVIYAVNSSGSYRYIPETNSLVTHNLSVNKETIRPHDCNWPSDANVVFVIVWNQTRMDNQYFASAEAGCLVQNIYLASITQNLGTTCVGTIDSEGLRTDLGLPSTMKPILVMPLDYPNSPYPNATPDYNRMNGNLPTVQLSARDFIATLNNIEYSQSWSTQPLSLQESSQLLWAAYGYSNTGHRTTPSAWGIYPLVVYLSNSTGTYRYTPESHSTIQIQSGDRRNNIAAACGNQLWVAGAPAIFLVALDSSYNGGEIGDTGDVLDHIFIEVDAGCVIQQILLEASATDLGAYLVSNGLESWNGNGAQTLRSILELTSSIIPLFIMPVGHLPISPTPTPITTPTPSSTPTPTPTTSPAPTPSASPSPTSPPSEVPTPTPETPEGFYFPIEAFYAISAITVIIVVGVAILALRKRSSKKP